MQLRRAGTSGLLLSAVGLGTLTWGRDTDVHDARELLQAFTEAGGTLVETSSATNGGAAEEVLGELLRTEVSRTDLVVCSQAGIGTHGAGPRIDAGRGALLASLDASLARLGTDYLDLWLVQAPDPRVDPAETVSAWQIAISSGRVRYVGVANHPGWTTAHLATLARAAGIPLAAAEVEYSLLERGAEREVLPAAEALGLGVIAWGPLGRGVLAGRYRRGVPADSRGASAHLRGFVEPYLTAESSSIAEAVATAARGLGREPAAVALAWARHAPGITSAVVGSRTPAQLRAALASSDELPEEIRQALDDVTAPVLAYPERRD